MVVKLLFIR